MPLAIYLIPIDFNILSNEYIIILNIGHIKKLKYWKIIKTKFITQHIKYVYFNT